MKNNLFKWILIVCLLSLNAVNLAAADEISLDALLLENFNAGGGTDAITRMGVVSYVQTSTQTPGSKPLRFFVGGKDKMKVLQGTPPLIEKAVVFNNGKITAKSVEGPVPLESINKTELYIFSRLFSGNFSLYYFKDNLTYDGLKKSGGSEIYQLETKYDDANITFDINAENYLLERIIIEQKSASGELYKSIYDIYPKGDVNGFSIPTGYYKSEIGNENSLNYGYGDEYLFSNYNPNEKVASDEFDKCELNYGEVKISGSHVEGNVTLSNFNDQVKRGVFYTNIGADVLDKMGIKEKDSLVFKIGDKKYSAVYIKSQTNITADLQVPGSVVISISARTPFHIILFYGEDYKPMLNGTDILAKINIIKE